MDVRRYSRPARKIARRSERGVTAIEYALLAAIASLALFAGAGEIGQAVARVLKGLAEKPFW